MTSATCSNWTCPEPGAGPLDPHRSLPSYMTLGQQVCSMRKPEEQHSKTPLFRKHYILINVFGLESKCQEQHSVWFQNFGLNIQMKKPASWDALRSTQYCLSGNQTLSKFSSTKKSEQLKRFSIFRKSDIISTFQNKLNFNFLFSVLS